MGWRRLVGSFKLKVSFAEYPLFCKALLQKRPVIERHHKRNVRCIPESCAYTIMGWLRLVGSLKLWVFFAGYRLFYRALLQRRPVILRSQKCTVYTTIMSIYHYGVATISRLLKIKGLFCRISSVLWGSFAKETCDFKEPTDRSHHIVNWYIICVNKKSGEHSPLLLCLASTCSSWHTNLCMLFVPHKAFTKYPKNETHMYMCVCYSFLTECLQNRQKQHTYVCHMLLCILWVYVIRIMSVSYWYVYPQDTHTNVIRIIRNSQHNIMIFVCVRVCVCVY